MLNISPLLINFSYSLKSGHIGVGSMGARCVGHGGGGTCPPPDFWRLM